MKKPAIVISTILIAVMLLTTCFLLAQAKPSIAWATIPAGSFLMVSPASEVDRGSAENQHSVTLSGFKMNSLQIVKSKYV